MPVEDLLAHVHPDILYGRIDLPAEQNALTPWREALACLEPMPEELNRLAGGCCGAECAVPSNPTDVMHDARRYLDRNAEALELLHTGMQKGRLQFSVFCSEPYWAEQLNLRSLFRLLSLSVVALRAEGRLREATQVVIDLLAFARLICQGEGGRLAHTIGITMRSAAAERALEVSDSPGITADLLRLLQSAVAEDEATDSGLAMACRVDFSDVVRVIDGFEDDLSLEGLVDFILGRFYRNSPYDADEPDATFVPDDRLAWRRKKVLQLLRGHPCPFSKAETLRDASARLAAELAAADGPWKQDRREKATRAVMFHLDGEEWPEHLRPGMPYAMIGRSSSARAERREAFGSWAKKCGYDVRPPSAWAMWSARRKLREVTNPVGILVVQSQGNLGVMRISVFRHRTQCRGVRAALAAAEFQMRHGNLPDDLAQLVSDGLLDAVPIDPYCDEPLRYSRERQIIWSVGPDGKDDGGLPQDIEHIRFNFDIVWRIPVVGTAGEK